MPLGQFHMVLLPMGHLHPCRTSGGNLLNARLNVGLQSVLRVVTEVRLMDDARRPPVHGALNQPEGQHHDDLPNPSIRAHGTVGDWVQRNPSRHPISSSNNVTGRGQVPSRNAGSKSALTIPHTNIEAVDLMPGGIPDLRSFADQLVTMAEQLRAGYYTAAGPRPPDFMTSPHAIDPCGDALAVPVAEAARKALEDMAPEDQRTIFADMARATYAKRRKRAAIFGDPELFGEPGWDILLDLYIAEVDGKPVSVSSACIGSAAPPTTGLRWLGVLADQGLVDRQHDPQDQRRVLVRLTEKAIAAMDEYFALSLALDQSRYGMHA